MNSSKNEVTRHFEEIWNEREDPEFAEKQRIRKAREERLTNKDLGL